MSALSSDNIVRRSLLVGSSNHGMFLVELVPRTMLALALDSAHTESDTA